MLTSVLYTYLIQEIELKLPACFINQEIIKLTLRDNYEDIERNVRTQINDLTFLDMYEVWLLNNETAYEKEFYYKNYSTIECSPSMYSPPLATHRSIRFFH